VQWFDFATSFPNSGGTTSDPYNIVASQNGRLRVVAAWDATAQPCNPDGSGCQGDVIDGDLDLVVSKRDLNFIWAPVCGSTTWDGTREMCDIPVSTGDVFKAELRKISANAAGTYVGIAWNNYDPNAE